MLLSSSLRWIKFLNSRSEDLIMHQLRYAAYVTTEAHEVPLYVFLLRCSLRGVALKMSET